jgi:hypothetical protein
MAKVFSGLPRSFLFFAATAVIFVLQAIPFTGIFLMFVLAAYWSVALVNLGMAGTVVEALVGRVSRFWLLLPVGFYGAYGWFAYADHQTLQGLTASWDAHNAAVSMPFDPERQSLAFSSERGGDGGGAWLTQNGGLPVSYAENREFPEGYLSVRMVEKSICDKVRSAPALRAAFVHAFGVQDGDQIGQRKLEERFCSLSMPERPELPLLKVHRTQEKVTEGNLPVHRLTTTIADGLGKEVRLLGGTAAPLKWFPLPYAGCFLNSGVPSWDCSAGFMRNGFTPVVSGDTKYRRDEAVLARALGLQPVAPADRKGGDPSNILQKLEEVEENTLKRQLANVDAMAANPLAKVTDWKIDVVANRKDALLSRADAIMAGIERAHGAVGKDRDAARESGRILCRLLASLPPREFADFSPRILPLYAAAEDDHWLWECEQVIRRMAELGRDALLYLAKPQALSPKVNGAGIEALCRMGVDARQVAEPVLLAKWQDTHAYDLDGLFVAMRRLDIDPPALTGDNQKRDQRLREEWKDISPQSPPQVCNVPTERQLRREAQRKPGKSEPSQEN